MTEAAAKPEARASFDTLTPRVEAMLERELRAYQALSTLAHEESLKLIHLQQSVENARRAVRLLMERLGISLLFFDPKASVSVLPMDCDRAETEQFLAGNSKVFCVAVLERLIAAVCFVLHRELQFEAVPRQMVRSSQKTIVERATPLIPLEKGGMRAYAALDWNEAVVRELMELKKGDVERFVGPDSLVDTLVSAISVEIEDAETGTDTCPPVERALVEKSASGGLLKPILAVEFPLKQTSLWMYLF